MRELKQDFKSAAADIKSAFNEDMNKAGFGNNNNYNQNNYG